ncbi:DUF7108 domain-containing protein [Halovivax cerinus]|uniref:RnhA operon protein n=1 Tax=Halovivax cerinus TaxID=1487865 RepID=A0ABD5NLY0_9EURY|nr:rnhA operon protein [Halovivax cerinus]
MDDSPADDSGSGGAPDDGERSRGGDRSPRDAADAPLPDDVVAEAERLTRLARNATDPDERAAYIQRRDEIVAEYDYAARVREADDTLVCHPEHWLEDGVVRTERIDDLSTAVERSLSGPGDPDDWAALDADNRDLVERVRSEAGDVHAANASAFADFMGNHCAKPMTAATADEIEQFLGEYYVRNAWPDPDARAVVVDSIEITFAVAGVEPPAFTPPDMDDSPGRSAGRSERGT